MQCKLMDMQKLKPIKLLSINNMVWIHTIIVDCCTSLPITKVAHIWEQRKLTDMQMLKPIKLLGSN